MLLLEELARREERGERGEKKERDDGNYVACPILHKKYQRSFCEHDSCVQKLQCKHFQIQMH